MGLFLSYNSKKFGARKARPYKTLNEDFKGVLMMSAALGLIESPKSL